MIVVVMGVSGSGKSTVGSLLAERLGAAFLEGDSLHPPANIAKMARGIPLQDEDRWPWLDALAEAMAAEAAKERDLVVSCSALRRAYRDHFRRAVPELRFVYLKGDARAIQDRLAARRGHFMPAALLESQFAALEPPTGEPAVLTLDASEPPVTLADAAAEWLRGGAA